MSYTANVLDARVITDEVLTPKRFVELNAEEKAKIKTVEIVPPVLGKKDFGGIRVYYKTPIYKVG